MKNANKIFFLLGFFAILASCSTTKDSFLNRTYHSLIAKYNTLFNGKEAYKEGLKTLRNNYQDDYFKQLPIEPIEFPDGNTIAAPKFNNNGFSGFDENEKEEKKSLTPFDKAEEKATKVIQLHSMNINRYEKNPQIDDAYLLLGKSRYYTQRFLPAIEAFNYIIANYPNASLINDTKVWRAKTNIRLKNEGLAIESLKILLDEKRGGEQLTNKIRENAHTALAMAYVQTDSVVPAIAQLKLATRTQEDKNQAARNLFILGQMYSAQNQKDSASAVFNRLRQFKRGPYTYRIQAEIALAKNYAGGSSAASILARLDVLTQKVENRPYLDALYYQKAILLEKENNFKEAIVNYNNSLRIKNGGEKQRTFTYTNLGDLYFKKNNYFLASVYYDSVIKIAKEDDLRIRRVKRKYKNLASLIKNEEIVAVNDSILKITSLSKEAQKEYFEAYIAKIKEQDEAIAQLKLNTIAFGSSFGGNSLQSVKQGKWYFYNAQSVSFGLVEFQKNWGTRKLADNWRWSSILSRASSEVDTLAAKKLQARYDLDSYLSSIPTDKGVIDSLGIKRNNALYALGLIYKEQFIDFPLAIKRLERLKTLNKDESKIVPIYYNLYQLYKETGNLVEESRHKEFVLNNYPESLQAQLITSPDKEVKTQSITDTVEEIYQEAYRLYKKGRYEEVKESIEVTVDMLYDSELIPKFELLRAYAIGKYKGQKSFRIALEFIAFSYPNSEEGKKAQELVKQINKSNNEK